MIALIDYGAGNSASVGNALEELGYEFELTANETKILAAEKIIFPGVGEASSAMATLQRLNLSSVLRMTNKPTLGVCLGMQLMAERSEEGNASCLGVVPGENVAFDPTTVNTPHMGWSETELTDRDNPLFRDAPERAFFYYAHSFYLPIAEHTTARCDYGGPFTASIRKNNYYGVQFHPEKSGREGLRILKNFIEFC
jgi:glutamine amidotransferase